MRKTLLAMALGLASPAVMAGGDHGDENDAQMDSTHQLRGWRHVVHARQTRYRAGKDGEVRDRQRRSSGEPPRDDARDGVRGWAQHVRTASWWRPRGRNNLRDHRPGLDRRSGVDRPQDTDKFEFAFNIHGHYESGMNGDIDLQG